MSDAMPGNAIAGENYYKFLFRTAAIWSWLVSASVFVGNASDEKLFRSILPRIEPGFILDMAVLPIFLFGCAYWWVSLDLTRNHAIIAVGAAGGMLAFVSSVIRAVTGDIPIVIVSAAVIDLIFGVLMLEFLLRTHRNPGSHED
jgi:hypothetical protein